MSLFFMIGVMTCILDQAYSNNFVYYSGYPGVSSYYQPYAPYGYAPYAYVAPVDCDQKKEEGGESSSSSSESSSSESSSSESSEEGGSKEGEEGGSSSEEGGEGGEGGESKEEESSSSSSSSEEGEKKKEEPKKKEKPQKPLFPPPSYTFPPRAVQQVVYSAQPSYPYMPYKTYSMIQAPVSYPVKSSYYSISNVPISAAYSGPVVKSYTSPQVTRIISSPVSKIMSVPSVSKGYGFNPTSNIIGASSYWAPVSNVGYYKA